MEKENKTVIPPRSLLIDARELEPFLTDLPPGALVGLMTEQEGYDEAEVEVLVNQASVGAKAGITDADVQLIEDATRKIALIDKYLPATRKALELMEESRAKLDDQRQRAMFAVGASVESRAKVHGDSELLGRYEKVRAYRSSVGDKAWRTRRRNEAEAARAQAEAASTAEPSTAEPSTEQAAGQDL